MSIGGMGYARYPVKMIFRLTRLCLVFVLWPVLAAAQAITSPAANPEAIVRVNPVGPDLGQPLTALRYLERLSPPVPVRLGMDRKTALRPAPVQRGVASVQAREFERVELALPHTMSGEVWDGYVVQHGRLTPLPVGSFLDRAAGRFMWQSTPGYIGEYHLMFVRTLKGGRRETLQVKVRFVPR